ncbi:MAG: transporter [Chitinophagaceae bacterium]
MAKIRWLLVFLLAGSFCGNAQVEKIDTDRPDQTESAVLVPRHYFQAEFGFNKENTGNRDYDLIYPAALLKYGMKGFEFRLEATYKNNYIHLIPNPQKTTGFEPLVIGFKAALWEEKKLRPKTSLIAHLGIPVLGSPAFRPDHLFPSFRFTFQNSLAEHIAIGYNLGAEWDGYTGTPAWIYTLAPGFELGEKWYAYVEAFGFIRKNESPEHNLDAGLAYFINPDLKIDISGGVGISESAPKNYIAVGLSFRVNTRKVKTTEDPPNK